ncbi:hypothetical protein ABIE48_006349 [Paenibacillus sp. OAE614]
MFSNNAAWLTKAYGKLEASPRHTLLQARMKWSLKTTQSPSIP